MTEIISRSTPKRASTAQRRVRSTESYALVRSPKHTYSGIRFFRASSCNGQITNILSVVELFGRDGNGDRDGGRDPWTKTGWEGERERGRKREQ